MGQVIEVNFKEEHVNRSPAVKALEAAMPPARDLVMLSDAMFFDNTPDLRLDQHPGMRSFYSEKPRTRYMGEFYDMLKEATAARNTMRDQYRSLRPEVGDEIAEQQANLEYTQLSGAQQAMRTMTAQLRYVSNAPDLPTLHEYVDDLAKRRDTRKQALAIKRSSDFQDIGALKRALLDMWLEKRQGLAKGGRPGRRGPAPGSG